MDRKDLVHVTCPKQPVATCCIQGSVLSDPLTIHSRAYPSLMFKTGRDTFDS